MSARATVTKDHRPGSSNNRHWWPQFWRPASKIKVSTGLAPSEGRKGRAYRSLCPWLVSGRHHVHMAFSLSALLVRGCQAPLNTREREYLGGWFPGPPKAAPFHHSNWFLLPGRQAVPPSHTPLQDCQASVTGHLPSPVPEGGTRLAVRNVTELLQVRERRSVHCDQ